MKLSRYDIFSAFKLFESILEMDSDLINLISSISGSSIVATELLRILNSRKDLKLNQNYLAKADANDEVKFMNDGQGKRIKDSGQNPFDSKTVAKIGRVVRQILVADGVTPVDADIEKFVNLYKAAWNKKYNKSDERMKLVKGDEIRFWYSHANYAKGGGTLNNSCMRYDYAQQFLDIYVNNPEVCQLLIYQDSNNDLIGRALVWNLDVESNGSKIFLDRIYTTNDHYVNEIYQFAVSKFGSINAHLGGLNRLDVKVRLRKWTAKYYPYMDSLYYITPTIAEEGAKIEDRRWGDAVIGNINTVSNRDIPYFRLRNASGGIEQQGHWVFSKKFKKPYNENEVKYIEEKGIDFQGRSATVGDYIPKHSLTYCDGEDIWVSNELAEYSELYKKTYRKTSLIDSKWGKIPAGSLVRTYDYDNGKLVEIESIPKILLNSKSEYTEKFVFCDVGGSNYYVLKDKCIPPVRKDQRYSIKGQKSLTYMYRVDLDDMVTSDNKSEFVMDPDLFGSQISLKKISIKYIGSGISSIYFDLKFGKYPIGVAVSGADGKLEYYCDESIVNTFKFKAVPNSEHWISHRDYYAFVFRTMVFKEAKEINDTINPGLNTLFANAHQYLMSEYTDYIKNQKAYDVSKYPGGSNAWIADVFSKKFLGSPTYFEYLMASIRSMQVFFSQNSSYTINGQVLSKLNTESFTNLIFDNIKIITLISMQYPIFGNNNSDVLRELENNMDFYSKECGIPSYSKVDLNALRLVMYNEVFGDYSRNFVRTLYDRIDGDFVYNEIRRTTFRPNVTIVFNLLWDKIKDVTESKIAKQKEVMKNMTTEQKEGLDIKSMSYADLLQCDGYIVGYDISSDRYTGTGKLSVENGKVFICQNHKQGSECSNKKGYNYSWAVINDDQATDYYKRKITAIRKPQTV